MSGKEPPVGAEELVSPRKSARGKRTSTRKEEVQAAMQKKIETLERTDDHESAKRKSEVAIMSKQQTEAVTGEDKQADIKKSSSEKNKMEVSNSDASTSRKSKRKSKISEENKQSNDNGSGIHLSQNAKETESSETVGDAINVQGQIKAGTSNKRQENLLNEKIGKGKYLKDDLDSSLNGEHDFKTPKTKRSEKITVTEKINDFAKVSPNRAKVSSDSDKVDNSKNSAVKTNKKTPRRTEAVLQVGDSADKIELKNVEEVKKSQTQSDPSSVPKRRGRPPKKLSLDGLNTSLDKSLSESIDDKSGRTNDFKNENGTDTIESTPRSARKRKKIDYATLGEIGSEDESDNDYNTPKVKKRKAKKKVVEEEATDVEEEIHKKTKSKPARSAKLSDDSKTPKVKSANEFVAQTPRSSRKRKKIDYAALDDIGSEEEDENDDDDDGGTPLVKKRKTKKKVVENSSEDEDTEVEESPKTKKSKTAEVEDESETPMKGRRGRKKAPRKEIKCSRCDQILHTDGDMKRHMAIKHQALWTAENPEGLEDSRSLNQVIKIKKFLICPKCYKQLNFLQYYKQHVQWCGRDDETFTCEICGHHGLLAKWRDMHEKACLKAKAAREEATKRAEALKDQKKEEKEALKEGEKRKRRAAKVASNMLHNLSQDKDLNLQDDLDDDNRDEDFEEADEEEEIEEEYEEDNEEEEEEPRSGSDSDPEFDVSEGYVDPTQRDVYGHFVPGRRKVGADKSNHVPSYNRYHLTFEMMNDIQKKHMSKDLYLDLLPKQEEWTALNNSDSQPYLPALTQSMDFTFSKDDGHMQNLQSYESVMVQGFPLCFTGLSIWKMAWCPTSGRKNDKQYLAVVGKPNHESLFKVNERVAAPGIIQIWNMGVTSNSLKAKSLPKLAFNIAHDYGMVTDLKWCPSGCWQEDKLDEDNTQTVLQRLGLLACSFTDSTVRIFSIPHVPDTGIGSVPTYKPSPVVTLVPHRSWKSCNITCSCVDWQSLHGHTRIVVGYSDGSVRIFHLLTKSSLQILDSSPHKILLPYHSFQGHLGLVRSCSWMHQYEDWVFTVGEDSSTYFWDLKNTSQPMNMENTAFMPLRVTSSLMYISAITSSDDNYSLNCNRTRCLEPATLPALANRRVYYTASQSACVWDVSYSNWLTYIIACDSRGLVQGIPCLDMAYYEADTKTYTQRLIMVETEVKWKNQEESQDTNTSMCSCESTEASTGHKCETHSEASCGSQSEHLLQSEADVSHSEKLLETDTPDSQSKDLIQETLADSTDQSDSLKQSISDKCKTVTVGSEKRDKSGRKIYPHKTYLQIKSKRPVEENQRKEPKTYSEIIEKKYLKFSEHLSEKSKKRAPTVDENFDTYDRVPISSLHALYQEFKDERANSVDPDEAALYKLPHLCYLQLRP